MLKRNVFGANVVLLFIIFHFVEQLICTLSVVHRSSRKSHNSSQQTNEFCAFRLLLVPGPVRSAIDHKNAVCIPGRRECVYLTGSSSSSAASSDVLAIYEHFNQKMSAINAVCLQRSESPVYDCSSAH